MAASYALLTPVDEEALVDLAVLMALVALIGLRALADMAARSRSAAILARLTRRGGEAGDGLQTGIVELLSKVERGGMH